MDGATLKQLQNVEFEILKAFDEYCRGHDIKYSLAGGSLLGAVRHGGFIPWDDDIDVAMTRAEYTKFCSCVMNEKIPSLTFSNFENDKFSGICHGKLGKEGTVFLQQGDVERIGHHEIWIDVFPLDKNHVNEQNSETIKIGKELVLLTRANFYRTNDGFLKRLIRFIVKLYPNRYGRMLKNAERLRELDAMIKDHFEWVSMSCFDSIKNVKFPRCLLDDYSEINFNGVPFMVFSGYREMLNIMYGDFMQMPPESERVCKHNPVKIKF